MLDEFLEAGLDGGLDSLEEGLDGGFDVVTEVLQGRLHSKVTGAAMDLDLMS
jgi:hypothetical protein